MLVRCAYKRVLLSPLVIAWCVWIGTFLVYNMRLSASMDWRPLIAGGLIASVLIPFSAGYLSSASLSLKKAHGLLNVGALLNTRRTQRLLVSFGIIAVSIILFNFWYSGFPPIFSLFGVHTESYMSYGRFKGVLFPLLCTIVVLSTLLRSTNVGKMGLAASILMLVVYVTRGFLIISMIQAATVIVQTSKRPNRTALLLIGVVAGLGFVVMQGLGSVRLNRAELVAQLEIRPAYANLPLGELWSLAYVGLPFVNAVSFSENLDHVELGRVMFDRATPDFFPKGSWKQEWKSLLPIPGNTVATFIGPVLWDFGIPGLVVWSSFVGLICGLVARARSAKVRLMFLPIILSCVLLMFFTDYFDFFPILVELVCAGIVSRYGFRGAVNRRYGEVGHLDGRSYG